MTNMFVSKIKAKYFLTADVIELRLEKPGQFSFRAGQFVQFLIPDGDKATPRSYSLAGEEQDSDLVFIIKLLPDGLASNFLRKSEVNSEISWRGPFGRFIKEDRGGFSAIATGAGLAPIISLIKTALKSQNEKESIHLLFGVRHETDIFYLDELETLSRDHENFSYTITLSQPSESWQQAVGRVTEHLSHIKVGLPIFICGSMEMIKNVRVGLTERGHSEDKIKFEAF